MEDRLNPKAPSGTDDTTLAGYQAIHGRSPTFEGSDGMPYSVAIETEAAEDADDSWAAYLLFLRWAETGTAIMGHLETDDLVWGRSSEDAARQAGSLTLHRVKEILEATVVRRLEQEAETRGPAGAAAGEDEGEEDG